jgi:hypothetical protein
MRKMGPSTHYIDRNPKRAGSQRSSDQTLHCQDCVNCPEVSHFVWAANSLLVADARLAKVFIPSFEHRGRSARSRRRTPHFCPQPRSTLLPVAVNASRCRRLKVLKLGIPKWFKLFWACESLRRCVYGSWMQL